MKIIGTSGSLDYLNDSTAGKRFWQLAPEVLKEAVEAVDSCDGIHDENAPPQYLCTRCYPQPTSTDAIEVDEVEEENA
jgi:hypothetical protein